MTLEAALLLARTLVMALLRASVDGALLAALVWGVLRLRPAWPAAARCALWWLVCARFVVSLAWPAPILVPVVSETWLPVTWSSTSTSDPGPLTGVFAAERLAGPEGRSPRELALPPDAAPLDSRATFSRLNGLNRLGHWWPLPVAVLWLIGISASCWTLARTVRRERVLLAGAVPAPRATQEEVDDLARSMGLASPRVLVSSAVPGPCVLGGRRVRIILPGSLIESSTPPDVLRLAAYHELVHVQRHDLAWGLIPALTERLLFFHPAARHAAREYALAREAACDAAVLEELRAPAEVYARLLIACAVPGRRAVLGMSGGSTSVAMLKRRLAMLHDTVHRASRKPSRWSLCLLSALALVPLQIGATRPSVERRALDAGNSNDATSTSAQTVQVAPPSPPAPPRPPDPPAPPAPPVDASHATDAFRGMADAWVLLGGDGSDSIVMGHGRDRAKASAYRRGTERLFWLRRGNDEYVIRDSALLDSIEGLFAPQRVLGRRMGALGEVQGELGAEQGALGARQGELGARQAALAAQQVALMARDLRETERRELEQEMRALGEQQRDLGREQAALGERQRDLGREQELLGKQMREVINRAAAELAALVDRIIKEGHAERVR